MFHPALLLVLYSPTAFAQTPATAPAFEAASVKPNRSGDVRMSVDFQPGGRFDARNVPMRILIALAYHVRPDAVTGGPAWLSSERFDIVAKAAQTTSPDEMRRMLQTLLAERFKLESHSDRKMLPAYSLHVAKNGSKLQPSEPGLTTDRRCSPAETIPGQRHVACRHMSMALFADTLQELAARDIDAPVVDQTGLAGAFEFELAWTPGITAAATPDPAAGPSIFEALERQLGLKLQNEKLPLPVIVVDRLERTPVEN